jgi:hypothetical protein
VFVQDAGDLIKFTTVSVDRYNQLIQFTFNTVQSRGHLGQQRIDRSDINAVAALSHAALHRQCA